MKNLICVKYNFLNLGDIFVRSYSITIRELKNSRCDLEFIAVGTKIPKHNISLKHLAKPNFTWNFVMETKKKIQTICLAYSNQLNTNKNMKFNSNYWKVERALASGMEF